MSTDKNKKMRQQGTNHQATTKVLQNSTDILGVFDELNSQPMSEELFEVDDLDGMVSAEEIPDINADESILNFEHNSNQPVAGSSYVTYENSNLSIEDFSQSPSQKGNISEPEETSNKSEEEIFVDDISDNEIMIIERDNTEKVKIQTGAGRKKTPIWRSFNQSKNASGKVTTTCKKCDMEVSCRPSRMRKHLETCRKIKEESRKKLDATARPDGLPCSSGSIFKPLSKAERQERISKWTVKQDTMLASRMDDKIGKFFFGCNVPFQKADSKYFGDIFKEPAFRNYTPPSAKRLKTTILDKQYRDCQSTLKDLLQGKKAVIIQDGWSTNQNDPVISHCLQAGKTPVFFDAVATETNKKTAQYCFMLLDNAIQYATNEYGCQIIGVVTDNCNVMKSLRNLVTEKYPDMFVYGCNAHIFNLLGQDLTDKSIVNKVVQVHTYFRNHHFESASLKKVGGKKPVLPVNTRWNSQLDSLRSFKENHLKYLEVIRMGECKISLNLRTIIEDAGLYTEVVQLIDVLQPIAIRLDESQGDSCTLADAYKKWITLKEDLVLTDDGKRAFECRMELASPPVAVAAFMLHPLYRGMHISREQQEKGFDFLSNKSPMLVALVASLRAGDTNMFPKHLLAEDTIKCMSSSAWWKSIGSLTSISGMLVDYCESLMLLSSSTACIERSFSTLGDIITKKRNRLAVEKAKKLCVVYKTLAMADNIIDEDSGDE